MKKKNRIFNWKPDVTDQRDYLFKDHYKVARSFPKLVDLSKFMSPVEDQGQLGSCTANAFAGNLEFLYQKQNDLFQASRLFVYYNERLLEGTVGNDDGAELRDGIKALAQYGVCSEDTVPYIIKNFANKPSAAAYTEGKKRIISKYLRVTDLASVKQCLNDGFPICFGIPVYESFDTDKSAKTGTIPNPKKSEEMMGGHAMLVVGYDDTKKKMIIRNSWGSGWGKNGYGTISYTYFAQADDMWTIRA